jgi:hypothetical protein
MLRHLGLPTVASHAHSWQGLTRQQGELCHWRLRTARDAGEELRQWVLWRLAPVARQQWSRGEKRSKYPASLSPPSCFLPQLPTDWSQESRDGVGGSLSVVGRCQPLALRWHTRGAEITPSDGQFFPSKSEVTTQWVFTGLTGSNLFN